MAKRVPPEAEQRRVALRVYTALDLMKRGRAQIEEWRDLSDGINIMEALCDLGKLPAGDYMPAITEAIEGMVEAIELLGECGRMRMSDPALDALSFLIQSYDSAIGRFSQATLAAAQAHVITKVAKAKANPEPSTTVVDQPMKHPLL